MISNENVYQPFAWKLTAEQYRAHWAAMAAMESKPKFIEIWSELNKPECYGSHFVDKPKNEPAKHPLRPDPSE